MKQFFSPIGYVVLFFFIFLSNTSCTKSASEESVSASTVCADAANKVIMPSYEDLTQRAFSLKQAIETFVSSPSDANLLIAQNAWYATREAWEYAEAWLIGPVSDENIDPSVDTWPVNYTDLKSVWEASSLPTEQAINDLDDALKGFHPIEYLLFGIGKTRTAAELNQNQKNYLVSLTNLLYSKTAELKDDFQVYQHNFLTIGSSSSEFKSEYDALTVLVGALVGICEEVAEGKMQEPINQYLAGKDPSEYEESPYSINSITDFTNNIKGVKKMYTGMYADSKGASLSALTRAYSTDLDNKIVTAIDAAINSFEPIHTLSYGVAIETRLDLVNQVIASIKQLKELLAKNLLEDFIQKTYQR